VHWQRAQLHTAGDARGLGQPHSAAVAAQDAQHCSLGRRAADHHCQWWYHLLRGLADAVISLELVGPDGAVRQVHKGVDADFDCSVISMGMMGVVTKVTLQLVPAYQVRQRVYGGWPAEPRPGSLGRLLRSIPEALEQTDSLSAFVQWSVDGHGMLICRDKLPGAAEADAPDEWKDTGARLRHAPIEGFLEGFGAFDATSRGPWHDKMHIWMRDAQPFGPQGLPELQLEHFVPLRHAAEALERTRHVAREWGSSLLYAEIRAVRGDGQALSPYTCDASEGYDTLAITNGLDGALGEARVLQASAVLEEALAPLRARPHWGKLFSYSPQQIEELYGERLTRFRAAAAQADPGGKFRNNWLNKMVMGE